MSNELNDPKTQALSDLKKAPRLTDKKYEDMTLPELLETRDKLMANKVDIQSQRNGGYLFKYAIGRIQQIIYFRRTRRKSGLIIPYNRDLTSD